jgi:hypothetical protein
MDSPASNALAHFVNLAMFLLGQHEQNSASPTHIAAELYRANRIENYDTCSLRITLADDVPLYVAYTHACATSVDPIVTIETERAIIRYVAGRHIEVRGGANGGTNVEVIPLIQHPHSHMLRAFHSCIRQPNDSMLCATLEMARNHVVAMNVASETSPVHDIPGDYIDTLPGPDHAPLRAIRNINPAMQACVSNKQMLCKTALAPWSVPAASKPIPRDYRHFSGPVSPSASPRVSVTTHTPPSRRPVPSTSR